MFWKLILCVGLGLVCGCAKPVPDTRPVGENEWLSGDTHEKLNRVAKHLRGFDMAMVEVGYRYNELYFAAQDRNWDYAKYQSDKIRTAIENGLERRPARAPSAMDFLDIALPRVHEAIAQQNLAVFNQRFEEMRLACQACHQKEQVSFIQMGTPDRRLLPFRFATVAAGGE